MFKASDIINKRIYARGTVPRLNYALQKVGEFKTGQLIGTVFSWIERADGLYWMIGGGSTGFVVKHDKTKISLDPVERRELEVKKNLETEKQKIADQGAIPYYIEKYGKWVLLAALAGIVLKKVLK